MNSETHISEEELLVLAHEGMSAFPASQKRALHVHLDECGKCSADLADELLHVAQASDVPSASCGRVQEGTFGFPLLEPGDLVSGRYRIVRLVGRGGMGDVYEATDQRLDQMRIALKSLNVEGAGNARAIERLAREARIAMSVSHPHAVRVYHFDSHELPRRRGQLHYLTMQWLEGETLEARLARVRRLSLLEVKHLAAQLLEALGAAHGHGFWHRDIKPSNVMLMPSLEGSVPLQGVLMDFGLAKPSDLSARGLTTASASFLGSALYASPEQVRGEVLSARSDLYSLGVVLFEALSGRRPFEGTEPLQVALARTRSEAPLLRSCCRQVPKAWEQLVARCLQMNPEARFGSARQLRQQLDQLPVSRLSVRRQPVRPGR